MRVYLIAIQLFIQLLLVKGYAQIPIHYSFDGKRQTIKLVNDYCVYDKDNHVAFTSLESWRGNLYLAFREGEGHVPTSKEDNGKIIILKSDGESWVNDETFMLEGIDLRDPFLLNWNNKLFLYTLGFFSELTETGWTPLKQIKHNAPHYLNIWKIREHSGLLYGIGNAYNEWPILLTSYDGINWFVKEEFKLGGNASEADMCFIKNKVFICVRIDTPVGSYSLFGRGEYPFDAFSWSVLDISIASPELIAVSNKKMLLAGREYDKHSKDGADDEYMTVLYINTKGEILSRLRSLEDSGGDKGYPSFCIFDKELLMSYYSGELNKTKIHLMKLNIK